MLSCFAQVPVEGQVCWHIVSGSQAIAPLLSSMPSEASYLHLHLQCGVPGTPSIWTPYEMQEARPVQPCAVTAGLGHTCLLTEGGDAYAFGWNGHGQLGNGSTQDAHLPQFLEAPLNSDASIKQVCPFGLPISGL